MKNTDIEILRLAREVVKNMVSGNIFEADMNSPEYIAFTGINDLLCEMNLRGDI